MAISLQKPELLAPAGSLESFFAAMEKGADAVYAGLHEFSARARARNFSLSQMERMLGYAHAHGRRIYITLNTLVKEQELPQLVETLAVLAAMRIDGVIVQDLAVARLVRNHFPSIPLHASTQMTIHNTAGVQMLAGLGFERVVLARELALDEVAAIAAATPVEIEVFVHGALCFSISGQCFFSSYLGGHSGNRGRCAQPCRRLYTHRGKQGHFFSTSDLSAIDMVPELVNAGVKSLKIEGRMKSAEYVASVVEAYRMVLDAPENIRKETLKSAKEILKYSFGRTPTKGFLTSQQPDDIANPWQKGGTGRFVGQIKSLKGKRLCFETRDALHVGDRLRAQPKSDMAGQAWTVRELFCNGKKVMEARSGSLVEVETPFRFAVGDAVYKVSSREAFSLSENACLRRLDAVKRDKQPCRMRVSLEEGNLCIEAEVAGDRHPFKFALGELEPARNTNMHSFLEGQLAKTGDAPFRLESLEAPAFPPVLIPAAVFKEIRRQLYSQLSEKVTRTASSRIVTARKAALAEIDSGSVAPPSHAGRESLVVVIDQPREWRFPLQHGADSTMLPLTKAVIHQLPSCLPRMRGAEEQVVWQLPFIIFDRDIPLYRTLVRQLREAGFRRFEVSSISHFLLLQGLEGLRISTWHRCFSLNSQALRAWQELGAETATLYIEDDAANLAKLLSADVAIERRVIAYAPLPVMTTKIRIKDVHSNIPLHSDRGEEYSVTTRDGLQTVTAALPFSLTARHSELRQRGGTSFVIDLRQARRNAWGDIIASFKAGREIPGTTEFNYPAELV
ncbi:U32 family peptidase [Geobacter sp. SVR]|uniref:peptidase U32 family protein n=1 Tax=Geobacter sp. SVR TaxID=2495594 RepID=UPI00143F0435|nr:U32 family peptidase [Geobacter sp. SVR]BCS55897.1 peptidase U32 [Geobacter sp. SVR]GCF84660.1 peptidase U32 [Geobacter sp. SVR]